MSKSKHTKITKEEIYKLNRKARRDEEIAIGFKGCQHKAHKMKTDYNRKREKKVVFDY